MGQNIRLYGCSELPRFDDKAFQTTPTTGRVNRPGQGCFITFGHQQCRAQSLESGQRGLYLHLSFSNARVTDLLCIPPDRSHNPVMGFDDGISDSRRPFHNANSKDGQAPITGDVPKPIRKISLPLSAQARDSMGWNVVQNHRGQHDSLQKFQPVELTIDISGVLPHLKLPQPDETACSVVHLFMKQIIEAAAHCTVEAGSNPGIDPPFGGNERIGTMPFDNRQPWAE